MKPVWSFAWLLVFVGACAAHPRAHQTTTPVPAVVSRAEEPAPASDRARESPEEEESAAVPVRRDDPSWGHRDALVTIVEFADFECPFCARAEATLEEVRRSYGPEAVRIVWKHNPLDFHSNAKPAAEAAQGVFELAGPEVFWKFHDAVLRDQESLNLESLVAWGAMAGIADPAALRAGIISGAWRQKVKRDTAEGEALGVHGTPTFFVNGIPIRGAQPFTVFQKIIDSEVAEAQAQLRAGTPRARLYVERSVENAKLAAGQDPDDPTLKVFRVPVGTSAARGSAAAWVTVVEFGDFQCPFCKQVEPTLKGLRERFGDRLRIIWKNELLPMHVRAEPAAELAEAVRAKGGNVAFWEFHDRVFASQPDLEEDTLLKLAAQASLPEDEAKKVLAEHRYQTGIDADEALADDFGVHGAPTFFINGRRVVGAQPVNVFTRIVEQEIDKAQRAISQGTKATEVYDALTKDGAGPEPFTTKVVPKSLQSGSPSRGNSRAKVAIHEFADFECPYCSQADAVVVRVLKEFGDKVRLVWHDLPLPMHHHAMLAARAAGEVFAEKGVDAFWRFHDKMFSAQDQLTRDDVDRYASPLNMDRARWKVALDGDSAVPRIDADAQAAREADIEGTPSFLIVSGSDVKGLYLEGAPSYWRIRKAIAHALGDVR
jgi:protein-disulfide isomerase